LFALGGVVRLTAAREVVDWLGRFFWLPDNPPFFEPSRTRTIDFPFRSPLFTPCAIPNPSSIFSFLVLFHKTLGSTRSFKLSGSFRAISWRIRSYPLEVSHTSPPSQPKPYQTNSLAKSTIILTPILTVVPPHSFPSSL